MSSAQVKIAGTALLLVPVFIFGFWLHRSGKPYPALLFNLHKLIALGAGVVLVLVLIQLNRALPFTPVQWGMLAVTVLCFAALAVSGGLLSASESMPHAVLWVHQVGPFAAVICAGVLFFLLLRA